MHTVRIALAASFLSILVLFFAFRATDRIKRSAASDSVDIVGNSDSNLTAVPTAGAAPTGAEAPSLSAAPFLAPPTPAAEPSEPSRREAVAAAPTATAAGEPTAPAADPFAPSEVEDLQRQIKTLELRLSWLEVELALCGSEVTQGPIGRWLATLQETERPERETLKQLAWLLAPYPVDITREEGLWLTERITLNDWATWGASIDEAIILFLGPDRLARELPIERVTQLRADWQEEGYFK
jgi:hypothetical protein